MRPPLFSGGNALRLYQEQAQAAGFNEASALQRRKHVGQQLAEGNWDALQ